MANGLPDKFHCKLCGARCLRWIVNDYICSSCFRFWKETKQYIRDNRDRIPPDRLLLLTRFLTGSFNTKTGEPNGHSVQTTVSVPDKKSGAKK